MMALQPEKVGQRGNEGAYKNGKGIEETSRVSRAFFLHSLERLTGDGQLPGVSDRALLERFAREHDDGAFRALVQRHGRLVFGVCSRVLRHHQDAEDAFQATFLVLARKSGSLRWNESIGPWLYQVACRVARGARVDVARRRNREARATPRPNDEIGQPDGSELASVLDEELERLPERFRGAVLLCDLQGLSREQAARQLGCPLGTLKHRLEGGRRRLRKRLTSRGLAPAALITGLPAMASAAPPPTLVESAIGTSLAAARAGASLGGATSAAAARWAEAVLGRWTLLPSKILIAFLFLALAAGILLACLGPALSKRREPDQVSKSPLSGNLADEVSLPAGAQARLGATLFRGTGSIAYAPDGRTLAVARGESVCLIDARSGKERCRLASRATALAYAPDGETLATGEQGAIALWEARAGRPKQRWRRADLGTIDRLIWDRNGRLLASQSTASFATARIWEAATGTELWSSQTLYQPRRAMHLAGLSADGAVVTTLEPAGEQAVVVQRDWTTGHELRRQPLSSNVVHVALSPHDNTLAASVWSDRAVQVWDLDDLKLRYRFPRIQPHIGLLAFAHKGRLLAAGQDGRIQLWDMATGQEVGPLPASFGLEAGGELTFAPDDAVVAFRPWSRGFIHLWEIQTGRELNTAVGHVAAVHALAVAPDARAIASGSSDGTIRIWQPQDRRERLRIAVPGQMPTALAFTVDGGLLACTMRDAPGIRFLDGTTGNELPRRLDNGLHFTALTASPCGGFLAAGAKGSRLAADIIVWDLVTGEEQARCQGHVADVIALAWSADSRLLTSVSIDGSARCWDATAGTQIGPARSGAMGGQIAALSADGRWLARAVDQEISVWDLAEARERRRFRGHDGPVTSLVFAPDGKTLMSGSEDTTVLLWGIPDRSNEQRASSESGLVKSPRR